LEFFTRFRGGSFQPLTHLSASDNAASEFSVVKNNLSLPAISKERLQHFRAASCQYPAPNLNLMVH